MSDGPRSPRDGLPEGSAVTTVRTASPAETHQLGARLAQLCRPGDVVLLTGDLGAGKTTLAQGFAVALGVGERVTSPTFVLVRQYPAEGGAVRQLVHADVYRLEDPAEIEDLALHELLEDQAVGLVEWGERAVSAVGGKALVVELRRSGPAAPTAPARGDDGAEERTIAVSTRGGAFEDRRSALAAALTGSHVAAHGEKAAARRGESGGARR